MLRFIELLQLRDIAFEYLPEIRDRELSNFKIYPKEKKGEDYWLSLAASARTYISKDRSELGNAAANMLDALSIYSYAYENKFILDDIGTPDNRPDAQELESALLDALQNSLIYLESVSGVKIRVLVEQ